MNETQTDYTRNGRRPYDYPACAVCKTRQADGYGSPGMGLPVAYRCNDCSRKLVSEVRATP